MTPTALNRTLDVRGAAMMWLLGVLLIHLNLVNIFGNAWSNPERLDRWWHLLPLTVLCLLMGVRRRYPLTVMAVSGAVFGAELWWGGNLGSLLIIIEVIYAGALYGRTSVVRWLNWVVFASVGLGALLTYIGTRDLRLAVKAGLTVFAIVGTSFWWGHSSRGHIELIEEMRRRAESVAHIAELREQAAVRTERHRMARDLHDALSGNLAAITIHAEAALTTAVGNAERQAEALRVIRDSSRRAMDELHTMMTVLRPAPGETAAPPVVAELPALVERLRGEGMAITLTVAAVPQLPAAVDQAAYRIVQESLHNASKHMPGGQTTVTVDRHSAALLITVTSHPSSTVPAAAAEHSPGWGLRSMRERAEALGGTVQAGFDGPTWVVRATLPLPNTPHEVAS